MTNNGMECGLLNAEVGSLVAIEMHSGGWNDRETYRFERVQRVAASFVILADTSKWTRRGEQWGVDKDGRYRDRAHLVTDEAVALAYGEAANASAALVDDRVRVAEEIRRRASSLTRAQVDAIKAALAMEAGHE